MWTTEQAWPSSPRPDEVCFPKHQEIFVQFAVNVMGVEGSFREPSAIIREGISRLERFTGN